MKRLLCIVSAMNAGGAETFLMKIYRGLDKEKYQMDFCVNSNENFYAEEIKKLGGKIYVIPLKSKNPIKFFKAMKKVVNENKYEYVLRISCHSLSVIDLLAAKSGGAKHLIMRSSNASSGCRAKEFLHKTFQFLPKSIPDIKLAPSKLAAEYTFGKKQVENGQVTILNNGLDIKLFKFNNEIREKYRKELNIEDKFVIGHVGRFNEQKNHNFLIQIFNEIKKKQDNAILLLIGQGELENKVKQQVHEYGLDDSVVFLGVRKDIPNLLFSMDLFLFPSFFEGMPNTVIEAQTTGLPCLISDSITAEAEVTKLVHFESLNKSADEWAEALLNISKEKVFSNRECAAEKMKEKGYDINDCIKKFEEVIFNN